MLEQEALTQQAGRVVFDAAEHLLDRLPVFQIKARDRIGGPGTRRACRLVP
jgi:hypothetical protein